MPNNKRHDYEATSIDGTPVFAVFERSQSDIVILLDADIQIKSNLLIPLAG